MTHLVTSLTPDSANSCVMQGTSCTQKKVSVVLFVLPSVLLLVVIVVTVVIVVVISIVVVVAIVRVVVVVVSSSVSSINKLSLVIVGYNRILEFKTSRDRYGNNGMSDPIGGLDKRFEKIKCDNTGNGGKIAGRAITTWGGGMASYACMTFIFESSCKGKKTSMSRRYLVKLVEESGEMFLGEAEK
nr:hypothetical protein [Tanacetum cinerariifolium]